MMIKRLYFFFLRYGFLIVLLAICDTYSPDFSSKGMLTDLDLDSQVSSQSGSNTGKQLFWSCFFVLYLSQFLLFRLHAKENKQFVNRVIMLMIPVSLCLLSVLWSEYPSFTLKRSVFQLLFILVASLSAYYAFVYGTMERSIKYASFIVIAMVIFSIFYGSGFNANGALAGYLKNKNSLASTVLLLLSLSYLVSIGSGGKVLKFDKMQVLIIALLISMLMLSASKTNILIFLLLPLLHFLHFNILKLFALGLFGIFSIIFIVFPFSMFFIGDYVVISDFVSEDFITGRGIIWEYIYYDLYKFEKLYLGYGYGSYFGVPQIPYYFDNEFSFMRFINSAHNGYLEILIQFGLFFSIMILVSFGLLMANLPRKEQYVLLAIPILQNFTESTFLRDDFVFWFLFIIVVIYHTFPQRKLES